MTGRVGVLVACCAWWVSGGAGWAQTGAGEVAGFQTISATQGNFGAGAPVSDDRFGHAVAPLGDLDGDGVPDLAVGESHDGDAGFNAGAVWILFLNPGGTVQSKQKITVGQGGFSGPLQSTDEFGSALAAIGDVDGDGVGDLAVGEWGDDDGGSGRGAVWVLFLNPNGTVKAQRKISATQGGFTGSLDNGDAFGISVSGIGDRNLDGVPDLAVGARFDDDGGTNRGAVYLLHLASDGSVKNWQKISDTAGGFTGVLANEDVFGSGVAGVGDLDHDGVVDVAVGAMQSDAGGNDNGAVWMLFLRPSTAFTAVKAHQKISAVDGGFPFTLGGDQFGSTVSHLGDYDQDGVADLGIGARLDGPGSTGGTLWIALLKEDGTVKKGYAINDTQGNFAGQLQSSDEFGNAIAGLGDVNGDGALDVAVGAWLADEGGLNDGAVYVLNLTQACSATLIEYGAGCPGSGGFIPEVQSSCPAAGSTLSLSVQKGFGGSTALLLLGLKQAAFPIGFTGCSLLVTPVVLTVPLPLGGSGPGSGTTSLFAAVPPSASGLTLTLQAFVTDPGPPQGYSTSRGLELHF